MSRRSSVVDLTSSSHRHFPVRLSTSPQLAFHDASSQDRLSTPRGVKRQREEDGSRESTSSSDVTPQREDPIESIDLTEVDESRPLARALAKQREDAVRAQQSTEHEKEGSVLASYKCPVCMDTPENATSTACGTFLALVVKAGLPLDLDPFTNHSLLGHLFCHKCIIDCLKMGEEQRADLASKARGTCPVCRKPLTRNEASGPRRSLIPLQLKLTTKKRNAGSVSNA